VLAGEQLVGLTLTIADEEGRRLPVRIDRVKADPKDPAGEITLYAFSIDNPATGERRNLCDPDPWGEQWGFPLAFTEDGRPAQPGAFSITCTSGARGKCVRFGYKPWHGDVRGVPMLHLYESCVRMMRADYCGDGTPHTRNGTIIDIYDRFAIQKSAPDPGMTFEAAWGPRGAVCLARTRIPDVATLDAVLDSCPRLRQTPVGAACTEASAPGALLFNNSF
jgi:hypothetical protein